MSPTAIGAIIGALGLLLLFTASRLSMLRFVLFCGLLNGSAAVILTSLGNVSVQPALLMTGLLFLRCLMPERHRGSLLGPSLAANGWLLLLVGYCFIGAYTLPFLFRGMIAVVPLRPVAGPTGLDTVPLRFTPQNITTSFYLLCTLLGATSAHMATSRPGAGQAIARSAATIALAHAAIGWFALAVRGTPLAALVRALRNGYYMQLDQSFDGFARITGISPEPSLYASFGFVWLVFTTELWLRNVDRRWSGTAALAMFVTLLASTSSTAYVGLLGYGAVVALRTLFSAGTISGRKVLTLATCVLALVACGLALVAGSDQIAGSVAHMLRLTTTDKLETGSGIARYFWAMQGLHAFAASWGLGIGVGSFRSSSILTALLGSGGLIAIGALAMYVWRVVRPFSRATYATTGITDLDVASAAAWAILMALVPASVSAPSPDPGLLWGLLAGSALGLRRAAMPQVVDLDARDPSRMGATPYAHASAGDYAGGGTADARA